MLLGAHQSVKGGLHHAFGFAATDACEGMQIFTKSSGQWKDPTHTAEQIAAFRDGRAAAKCGTAPVLAHGSYLPNLCSWDAALVERSRVSLVNEVLRCDAFGIEQVGVVELPPTEIRRGREVRVIKPLLNRLRALAENAEVPVRKRA